MKNNSDKSATGQCLQPNKYNSKELDLMHGYDYGKRILEQKKNNRFTQPYMTTNPDSLPLRILR